MNLKGLDALREHLPALTAVGGAARIVAALAAVFLLTCLFFVAADLRFAEWMPDGEIVVLALGFLILSRFFSQRKRFQQKYDAFAYQQALLRFSIPGLGIIAASIAHLAYIAGPDIPDIWWKPWLAVLGWLLVLIGAQLWMRSAGVLGIDNLAMLYVYYPKESQEVSSGIYGILRHPIYSASLDVGFGLALIHGNWYAILVALILPIFYLGWVRLVEEPELISRFPHYAEYRRHVPAFTPSPLRLQAFLQFLLTGT